MNIGKNAYFAVGEFGHIHLQTILTCVLVIFFIFSIKLLLQFFFGTTLNELFFSFILDISKSQESGPEWVPFLGRLFLFIFVAN